MLKDTNQFIISLLKSIKLFFVLSLVNDEGIMNMKHLA